jgi:hypothetical protein
MTCLGDFSGMRSYEKIIFDFAELIGNIGWENGYALGLVLVNLQWKPANCWYFNNMDVGYFYDRKQIEKC